MLKEEVEVSPVSDKLLIWLFQLIIKKYRSLNTYNIKADGQIKKERQESSKVHRETAKILIKDFKVSLNLFNTTKCIPGWFSQAKWTKAFW